MPNWKCVLQLDPQRRTTGGSPQALVDAIRRGADLRIGTEFRHNEHIDTDSDSNELIREVAEFGVTFDSWGGEGSRAVPRVSLFRGGQKLPASAQPGERVTLRALRAEVGNDASIAQKEEQAKQ